MYNFSPQGVGILKGLISKSQNAGEGGGCQVALTLQIDQRIGSL